MAVRFRRSVKILPGVRLNASKSGISTSIGGKGLSVNLSKKGTRVTAGIPGTGFSVSEYTKKARKPEQEPTPQEIQSVSAEEAEKPKSKGGWIIWLLIIGFLVWRIVESVK